MTLLQRMLVASMGGGIIAATFEMIRRRRLKEEYSLLWFLSGCVTLLFSVFPGPLYWLSDQLHLHHLTTMLMVAFGFLLGIVLHYSMIISRLSQHERELAQLVALLQWRMEHDGRDTTEYGETRSDQSHRYRSEPMSPDDCRQ